jgi:hypothetical protein
VATTDSSDQGVQENTINRQTICSMDHATCTTRMSTEKECQGMQWKIVGHSLSCKKR